MLREELREHCERQIRHCEIFVHERGVEPSGNIYEELKIPSVRMQKGKSE